MTEATAAPPRSLPADLLSDFERLRKALPGGDPRLVTTRLPELASALRRYINPDTLEGLRRHNEACACGEITLRHIALLAEPGTSVILTTHTPQLLTGTLRLVYKALTTVQLSTYCRETLGLRTVPVLWLTAADTQTAAGREIKFPTVEDRLVSLMYEPDSLDANGCIGAVPLEDQIDFLLRLLARDTADTNNKRYLSDLLRSTRTRSRSLGEWTARLVHALFHTYGLIVIADDQPYVTIQAARALHDQIGTPGRAARLLGEARATLAEAGYPVPETSAPDAVPFAFRDGDGLETWRLSDDRFTSSRERTMDIQTLRTEIARRHGDLVLRPWMRPVVQAAWLPVLAVVADPAGVELYALQAGLHAASSLQMPLVYPHVDVVLVERRIQQLLEQYGLTLEEIALPRKTLVPQIQAKDIPRPVLASCDRKLDRIQSILDELREDVALSNPEYTADVDQMKRQVGASFEGLHHNLVEARTESPMVIAKKLDRVRAHLYPEGQAQADVLNIFPLLFAHGIQLINRLATEVDVFAFERQMVRL